MVRGWRSFQNGEVGLYRSKSNDVRQAQASRKWKLWEQDVNIVAANENVALPSQEAHDVWVACSDGSIACIQYSTGDLS